jgi:taurine dioxygenase
MIGLAAVDEYETADFGAAAKAHGRHLGRRVLLNAEANGEVSLHSNTMTMRPLTGSIGAEILDLDLREIDDAGFADIRRTFFDRCMLVFRDQHLDAADLLAFTRRWGEVFITPHAAALDGFPEVIAVRNRGKLNTTTEYWHTDSVFAPVPPALSVLASQVLPPAGGDTMFANQYLAYETLSPGLSALAGTLRAGYYRAANMGRLMGDLSGAVKTSDHPVVRTHPETGRKALYLSYDPTVRLEGFSEVESRAIVALFAAHATQPMFCYRHRWQPGDVLMWDNRCALHFAVHDYGEQERMHYRTTVAGDVPR